MPPRRPVRAVPTVIIPGWNGSGEGHWQTWLESELPDTRRPDLPDLDAPDLEDWLTALRECLADLPADGYDVVAHSLGAVLWLHHVGRWSTDPGGTPRAARVVLVSPPSPTTSVPEVAEFFPPPLDVDTVRRGADGTVLVAGSDDPYLPEGIATAYSVPLKMATTVIDGGGHLNTGSGFGEWPAMLSWCRRDNLAFY